MHSLNPFPFPECFLGVVKIFIEYQQKEHVYQFLMGLNDSYSTVRSQILTMYPLHLAKHTPYFNKRENNERCMLRRRLNWKFAAMVGKRRRNGMKSHLNPLKINTSSSTIELGLIQSVSITIDNIKGK